MSVNDPFDYNQILNKSVSHQIKDLFPNDKNIELRCIIVKKEEEKTLQNNKKLFKYLIADSTGSISCNFFNEELADLECGEVLYLNGFVTNIYKNSMVMYQSRDSKTILINRYKLEFVINPKQK